MIRIFAAAALAAVLTACASTPTYGPATRDGGAGYTETQIESNRFFVTYRAPGGADRALVQDYALLRAADLTLQNGREWFWVDRRTFEEGAQRSGPSIGIGVGGGRYGGSTGTFGSVGVNVPVGGGGGGRARAATLEIRLGEGVKPDDPNAYDARAISQNIRARIVP